MTLIKSLLIFYPLIIPVWQQGPFDNKNIDRAPSLDFLQTPKIQFQIESFKKIKDPRIRSRIAIDLIDANNPDAIKGLGTFLASEKDILVKGNILNALYRTKHVAQIENDSLLKKCLQDPDANIRGFGAALYLYKTKDATAILSMLKDEKSLFVQNLLWNDLKGFVKESPVGKLEGLINSENPVIRAGAARVLAMRVDDPDTNSALKKAVTDKEIIVRALLGEGLASRPQGGSALLAKLAKDKSVAVRTNAAAAKTDSARMQMHIDLSTDSDPEVRRLAVVALRNYQQPTAIDALLKAMNDPYKPVRTAVEDSLIAMKASSAILERVGKEYLNQEPAAHSAVRVLGALNDQRFNDKILEILNSTSDTDMMRRAVNALGKLDYKKAAGSIAKKASCKDPLVRENVGRALGFLNIKDTFETMIKLSSDADNPTSLAAIRGMGVTKDPYFINCLMGVAKDVKRSSNRRSFAYWSMAQINQPSQSMVKLLEKNILKKIIPIPMSPPDYDSDFARIGAALALVEMGRKDAGAKKAAIKCIGKLNTPAAQQGMEYISGETLQEYARQADLYMQGKDIEKVPLPTAEPVLTVKKYKSKKKNY